MVSFSELSNRQATFPMKRGLRSFWAKSTAEVDRLTEVVRRAGGCHIEGPGYGEGPGYYALFFEDPSGNRLEICHRRAAK